VLSKSNKNETGWRFILSMNTAFYDLVVTAKAVSVCTGAEA
jgi:hypothetical protein